MRERLETSSTTEKNAVLKRNQHLAVNRSFFDLLRNSKTAIIVSLGLSGAGAITGCKPNNNNITDTHDAGTGIPSMEDAGDIQLPDAARFVSDAGSGTTDGGGREFDAGLAPTDAGVAQDAGDTDAGSSASDAGTDAGATPLPDDDGDGIPNDRDVCRQTPDFIGSDGLPLNTDGDPLPDACDPCPARAPQAGEDPAQDTDRDGYGDPCDNAPYNANYTQTDRDLDSVGDIIDNCISASNPWLTPNPWQIDIDGDGYGPPCDCNDGDPTVNPGVSAESEGKCSTVDKNCDGRGGLVREEPNSFAVFIGEPECTCVPGRTRPIGRTIGACIAGEEICAVVGDVSGFEMTIVPEGSPTTPETCNGIDDNCDGLTDALPELGGICECDPATDPPRPCGITQGECVSGTQPCLPSHMWSDICEGEIPASISDQCDGKDNDCDGRTDEDYNVGAVCGTGACAGGQLECAYFGMGTRCSTGFIGSQDRTGREVCDGIDNNCDGRTDEDMYPILTGEGYAFLNRPCYMPGICQNGHLICHNQDMLRCNVLAADVDRSAPENSGLCNDLDDDCDGVVDDGCACINGSTQICGYKNIGRCREGVIRCRNGRWDFDNCEGTAGPTEEICNNLDDDCDGATDEDSVCNAAEAPPPDAPPELPPPPPF